MIKKSANIITSCRVIFSILLLFTQMFSPAFYIIYLFCGFTDIIDGVIARKTDSCSDFGSKLDSGADFLFAIIALIKILPVITIPQFIWIWIAIIFLIKILNIMYGLIKQKKYVVEHTNMNKITGLMLFIFPLTLPLIEITFTSVFICFIATIAAIQEGYYIKKRKEIN